MQRRCIHDELGRVDPSKAAEPSKPRGSATGKRPARPSDEHGSPGFKRPKLDNGVTPSDPETMLVNQAQSALAAEWNDEQNGQVDFNSLIDPALMDTPSGPPQPAQPILGDAIQQLRAATDAMTKSTKDMTASRASGTENSPMPPVAPETEVPFTQDDLSTDYKLPELPQADSPSMTQPALVTMPSASSQTPAGSLASPPDSLLHDPGFSPTGIASVELNKSVETNGGGSESSGNPLHTPNSASRHSSRQPIQIGRYVPDAVTGSEKPTADDVKHEKPVSEDTKYARRASSSGASALTSLDGKSRRSSNVSIRSGRMSTAPMSQTIKAESPATQSRRVSRARSSFGAPEMDEESLKLIRALQQEDLGLRRRGGRV